MSKSTAASAANVTVIAFGFKCPLDVKVFSQQKGHLCETFGKKTAQLLSVPAFVVCSLRQYGLPGKSAYIRCTSSF